jgi:topoisomerase IV subunit A
MPRKNTPSEDENLELPLEANTTGPSTETNLPDAKSQTSDPFQLAKKSGHVDDMFSEWFLDYASYVILERAVPHANDGLKPVQRRILHSMNELEDGRYNKVANVIGNTMKYHPHGDASIADAMVQLGQKGLLIDMQGNWGNTLTGDSAAAARYIEARLSKFALDIVFNPKTTNWLASYDGRNKEPETQPVKFPLLLAQGAEGIAVGLACKILPHNFIELLDGCIDILGKKETNILPDFPSCPECRYIHPVTQ